MREIRASIPSRFLDDLPSNLAVKLEFEAEDLSKCDSCDLFNIKLRDVALSIGKSSIEGEYDVTVRNTCDEALRSVNGCGIGEFIVNKVAREPELLPLSVN